MLQNPTVRHPVILLIPAGSRPALKTQAGVLVRFQLEGEQHTQLLHLFGDEEILKDDATPTGEADMEEVLSEVGRGRVVSVLLHKTRARIWALSSLQHM